MILYSTLALTAGYILDLVIGDPQGWPHLIRLMGTLLGGLERLFYRLRSKRLGGVLTVIAMLIICTAVPAALLYFCMRVSPWLFFAVEALFCWQLLAVKSLRVESGYVYEALKKDDIPAARHAIAMIVGRDTAQLDSDGITRAAVETVAENTADGVIAPLFFLMLGGAPLGCLYKAVNTMDSTIGYKNEKYIDFGRCAARLDDVLGYLPARLSALLIIVSAWLSEFDAKNAYRIWRRDRRNHASPNSAQSEAAVAGALRIRLAGDAYYFGKLHKKPFIGDDLRPVEPDDIRRSHNLLNGSAALMLLIAIIFRGLLYAAL